MIGSLRERKCKKCAHSVCPIESNLVLVEASANHIRSLNIPAINLEETFQTLNPFISIESKAQKDYLKCSMFTDKGDLKDVE